MPRSPYTAPFKRPPRRSRQGFLRQAGTPPTPGPTSQMPLVGRNDPVGSYSRPGLGTNPLYASTLGGHGGIGQNLFAKAAMQRRGAATTQLAQQMLQEAQRRAQIETERNRPVNPYRYSVPLRPYLQTGDLEYRNKAMDFVYSSPWYTPEARARAETYRYGPAETGGVGAAYFHPESTPPLVSISPNYFETRSYPSLLAHELGHGEDFARGITGYGQGFSGRSNYGYYDPAEFEARFPGADSGLMEVSPYLAYLKAMGIPVQTSAYYPHGEVWGENYASMAGDPRFIPEKLRHFYPQFIPMESQEPYGPEDMSTEQEITSQEQWKQLNSRPPYPAPPNFEWRSRPMQMPDGSTANDWFLTRTGVR